LGFRLTAGVETSVAGGIASQLDRGHAACEVVTGYLNEGTDRGGEHRRFGCVSGACSRASLPNPSPIELPAPERWRL
jgi:hypothetical protein